MIWRQGDWREWETEKQGQKKNQGMRECEEKQRKSEAGRVGVDGSERESVGGAIQGTRTGRRSEAILDNPLQLKTNMFIRRENPCV